jgi:formamidopyrimidine-DNA glycosylase
MPELPDINAYLHALDSRIVGQVLRTVRIGSPFVLRTAQPPIADAQGRVVRELQRIGKRVAIGLDNELWIVIHLMIAGRLHWRAAGAKLGGRNNLAAFDFDSGSLLLTEAGTKRRASIYVVSGAAALHALDPGGIGNAYSDEVLHAAQLSPTTLTQKLKPEEWQRLYDATQATLHLWVDRMQAEADRKFPEKVTAFRPEMAVHGRFGLPCPRCGDKVQRIRYADNETNYCARCQTGGKLLADRALSRLLGMDWPRSLDELEALKKPAVN